MSTTREWRDSYRYTEILLYLREENSQRRNECTYGVARPMQDQGNLERDVERVKKKRRLEREEKNMGEFKRWNIDGEKQRRIAFEKKIDASGRINSPLQIHY